jgi:hypothetical protein
MRAKLLREYGVLWPAPDGRDLVAELLRELNAKVPEPTDTLDGDEITGQRAAVAQRIERRDAGAHERSRLGRVE